MKNSSLKPVLLLMCVLSFAMCENPVVNREYYDSGVVKVEERLNKEGEVVKRRGFYEDGTINFEESFSSGLPDGAMVQYYPDGSVEFMKEFDRGKVISYVSFDSLGNKGLWYNSLRKSDIPAFKDVFIQVVGCNDSGLAVNLSVPGISPYQLLPVTKNANWKSIDIKNGDWLLLPKHDTIEVGIGIEMTDSTFSFMGSFKSIIVSELP